MLFPLGLVTLFCVHAQRVCPRQGACKLAIEKVEVEGGWPKRKTLQLTRPMQLLQAPKPTQALLARRLHLQASCN